MDIKQCRACPVRSRQTFDADEDDFQEAVLKHYLNDHPEDDGFRDVITSSFVERGCGDCGEPFFATVSYSAVHSRIAAEAYCPECDGEELIRPMLVVDIPVSEFVAREAEPSEADLGEKTRV